MTILDAEQSAVINSRAARKIIRGGPGCGKTTLAIAQVKAWIADGFDPAGIWCITFSVNQAAEMADRLEAADTHVVTCGTVHSIALSICQRYGGEMGIKVPETGIAVYPDPWDYGSLPISAHPLGAMWLEVKKLHKDSIARAKRKFWDGIHAIGAATYESLIYEATKFLASNNEDFLYPSHVIVDEAQDLAEPEELFIGLLCSHADYLYVCGDPDQRIYSWRGARGSFLELNDASNFQLNNNYRSAPEIVAATRALMKRSFRAAGGVEGGVKISIVPKSGKFCKPENSLQMQEIYRIVDSCAPTGTVAVLCRTNVMCDQVRRALNHNWIVTHGGATRLDNCLWYRKFLEAIRLVLNPWNAIAARFLYKLTPAIEAAVAAGKTYAEAIADNGEDMRWYRLAQDAISPENAAQDILDHVYGDQNPDGYEEAWSAIREVLDQSNAGTLEQFLHWLVNSRFTGLGWPWIETAIFVGTVHAAKGQEYDTVIVPGVNEGVYPCYRGHSIKDEDLAEERRVFYVAISRARKHLHLIAELPEEPDAPRQVSRFLDEIRTDVHE